MKIKFYKYQGTGNDFVIITDTEATKVLTQAKIEQICDRRFGIGADGFIILNSEPKDADIEMIYYNSDGRISSFCGNGSRCTAHCAHLLGLAGENFTLKASDGIHEIKILDEGLVAVTMLINDEVRQMTEDEYFIDTGSPHLIKLTAEISKIDINADGRAIRNRAEHKAHGVNVNFVERLDSDSLAMRTYERGVEAETLSCGTGVTAAAIVNSYLGGYGDRDQKINAVGGQLRVKLSKGEDPLKKVILIGPAVRVYEGTMNL